MDHNKLVGDGKRNLLGWRQIAGCHAGDVVIHVVWWGGYIGDMKGGVGFSCVCSVSAGRGELWVGVMRGPGWLWPMVPERGSGAVWPLFGGCLKAPHCHKSSYDGWSVVNMISLSSGFVNPHLGGLAG